jgi:23S rRNA pseudouridine2605 synthase
MEELILAGRITVNRMPAEIGQKVGPGDEVRINGEPVKIRFAEPPPRVLIYHKPPGEIVSRDDPEDRSTVFEDLPPIEDAKWIAVGRLDYNTEGLLLFTNSGELANRLMHPRYEVEREYAVRIMGRLDDEQMLKLTTGVELDDGPARCDKVDDAGGEEEGANHWYHVVLKEGRNREVRRLFEALGVAVSRLIRTRYGRVSMPAAVKRGQTQELTPPEINALLAAVGLRAPGGQQGKGPRPQHGAGGRPPRRGHGNGQGQPGNLQGQGRPQGQGPRGPGVVPRGDSTGPEGQHPRGPRESGQGPRGPGPREPGQGARGHAQGPRGQGQGPRGSGQGSRGPGQGPRGPGQGPRGAHGPHGDGAGPRSQGNPGSRPGNNPFRHGKPPRAQGGQGQGGYGQGGYGQEGNGNRQPRLTSHGQPPVTSHTQPQLTMHTHGFGNARPNGQGFGGKKQNRNRDGAATQPPRQRWEGLPKDEDEPK